MIHTIGDSHAKIPWEKISGIKVNHLGPILAFSVGRDNLSRVNISNIGLKPNDCIIFCFGEIDCRGHIHKHLTENNTYQKQIDSIVKKYFDTIKLNKDLIKFDIQIAVNNVVPAYELPQTNKRHHPQFPFLGSNENRKVYVKYFNSQLKKYCDLNNYLFIDVYDKYTDSKGFLNKSLSDGNIHIGNTKHLFNFLKENFLI